MSLATVKYRKREGADNIGALRLKNIVERLKYDVDYAIEISEWKDSRSLRQNNYYWKILEIIGDELGYYKNEIHEVFLDMYSPIKTIKGFDGKPIQKKVRTSEMNVDQMKRYLDQIIMFAAQHSIRIPGVD